MGGAEQQITMLLCGLCDMGVCTKPSSKGGEGLSQEREGRLGKSVRRRRFLVLLKTVASAIECLFPSIQNVISIL